MPIYETFASLTFATIDLIAFEILLLSIIIVDDGKIKLTFDFLSGMSSYRNTYYYVFPALILGIIYFYLANMFQETIISYISLLEWKTMPLFISSVSFAIFWMTKISLGRRWIFPLVWISGGIFLLSLIPLFF